MRTVAIALAVTLVVGCAPVAAPSASPSPSAPPTPTVVVASATATVAPSATNTPLPTATSARTPGATAVPFGELASSKLPRTAADRAAAKGASAAVRSLAVDLYKQLAAPSSNLVFSPYSIAVALAMTRSGARTTTAQQMGTVLHADAMADVDAAFNALDQILATRAGSYQIGYGPQGPQMDTLELATADQLFAQRGSPFAAPFLDTLAKYYGTGVGLVDFVSARETARQAINAWVSDRTKARIPELIKPNVLNDLTRFVLTNAVYLKARWIHTFSKQHTAAAAFHRLDGRDVQAQLMRQLAYVTYAKGAGYEAVGLPYYGGLSMVVIVPDAGAFASFETALDAQRLGGILEGLRQGWVDLSMPKFEFRTASPLREPLARLGMPIAFTEGADFSGMSSEKLMLQDAVHESFIGVDENGTEAAAATAFIGGATGGPNEWATVTVDRPFVFAITDDETGAILFMGRVLDPS